MSHFVSHLVCADATGLLWIRDNKTVGDAKMVEFLRAGALLAAAVACLPGYAHAQAGMIYAEMIVQQTVDHDIECAATLTALGGEHQLAATVAGYFLNDAVNTMTTLGGWKDRDAATQSVLSRTMFMTEDIAAGLGAAGAKQVLLDKQEACVLGALHD